MRTFLLSPFLFVAVLVPTVGNAQVYMRPAEPPKVTAAGASWQINGEPVLFAGDFYFPAGATVFFDGNVMARSGTYRGVPLYTDATLEPHSVVFVPIGGKLMRPYERKRAGELAGTEGSRAPSFPPQRDVEASVASDTADIQTPPLRSVATAGVPESDRPVGTGGSIVPTPARSAVTAPIERRSRRSAIETIPAPRSNAGVWIEFGGARWHSAGRAVTYSPERFTPIGSYHGLVVYRDASDPSLIYVPAVEDGPLAPYRQ